MLMPSQRSQKLLDFTISANEIQNIESPPEVLSDGELEGVAGGGLNNSKGIVVLGINLDGICGHTINPDTIDHNKYPMCRTT
jgi:hypothetical protein